MRNNEIPSQNEEEIRKQERAKRDAEIDKLIAGARNKREGRSLIAGAKNPEKKSISPIDIARERELDEHAMQRRGEGTYGGSPSLTDEAHVEWDKKLSSVEANLNECDIQKARNMFAMLTRYAHPDRYGNRAINVLNTLSEIILNNQPTLDELQTMLWQTDLKEEAAQKILDDTEKKIAEREDVPMRYLQHLVDTKQISAEIKDRALRYIVEHPKHIDIAQFIQTMSGRANESNIKLEEVILSPEVSSQSLWTAYSWHKREVGDKMSEKIKNILIERNLGMHVEFGDGGSPRAVLRDASGEEIEDGRYIDYEWVRKQLEKHPIAAGKELFDDLDSNSKTVFPPQ